MYVEISLTHSTDNAHLGVVTGTWGKAETKVKEGGVRLSLGVPVGVRDQQSTDLRSRLLM